MMNLLPEHLHRLSNKFLAQASDFYLGYECIAACTLQNSNLLPVRYQLLCQALELALKGWLVSSGVTETKRTYGHNLVRTVEKVIQLYGPTFPQSSLNKNTLELLNNTYKRRGYIFPDENPTMQMVEDGGKFARFVKDVINKHPLGGYLP